MENEKITLIDINEEMRNSYLDYAMSVIVARALPDARDGLKPVHRRILYAMHTMGLQFNRSYRKSARIVGEVLGKYHPHGDSAVYDSMVRMAQPFSLRYPLVDGQGNFGSVDGDAAAAMRYTEAKLFRIAGELIDDIDKNTVDFTDNFDGSEIEPEVMPARLPNLLLNGTSGIAVGMSTNIPPHNLGELVDAIVYLIDRQGDADDITLDEMMQFVKGPDFPTGGEIIGVSGIRAAYATGRGRVVMRCKSEITETKAGRARILITEIPYQVNKANLVQLIAELVNRGVIPDIADLRDESGRAGMRIVIDLKRGSQPQAVLNQLYRHTPLQSTFGVQMLALVDKQPRLLSLKRALQAYIDHRIIVTIRRIQFELEKALKRQHILEGLLIALTNLDAVIQMIRESRSAEHARQQLIESLGLSELQAQAILDLQLRRLAALEQQKIEDEYQEINLQIETHRDLLANRPKLLLIIRAEVLALKELYNDARRTVITHDESEFDIEDLIRDEKVLVSITERGYIKRTRISEYRVQGRGGRGLIGMTTRDEDSLETLFVAGSKNTVLFFTNEGKVYSEKTYRVPEAGRTARGTSIMNLLPLAQGEKVTAALPVEDFELANYLILFTRMGRIKRVELSKFDNVRTGGIIGITLDAGDELRWVKMTQGEQDVILVSEQGKGIRFNEEDVRPMGRTAAGVNALRLNDGDYIAGADVVQPSADLLIVTRLGYGKRTPLSEYRTQSRYGSGVRSMVLRIEHDQIIGAHVVTNQNELTCISSEGIVLRTPVNAISRQSRITQGVRVMEMREGDAIVSIAVIQAEQLVATTEPSAIAIDSDSAEAAIMELQSVEPQSAETELIEEQEE